MCWCAGVFDASIPYGGLKDSGVGLEAGVEGLAAYSESKTVVICPNVSC